MRYGHALATSAELIVPSWRRRCAKEREEREGKQRSEQLHGSLSVWLVGWLVLLDKTSYLICEYFSYLARTSVTTSEGVMPLASNNATTSWKNVSQRKTP